MTSSATEPSASLAFPWTLSSVRLKTTFGSAHQTSANADLASLSRRTDRLPHEHRLVEPAAEQIPAELAHLGEVKETARRWAVQSNAPSRSAMKPSTETLIE